MSVNSLSEDWLANGVSASALDKILCERLFGDKSVFYDFPRSWVYSFSVENWITNIIVGCVRWIVISSMFLRCLVEFTENSLSRERSRAAV